MRKEYHQVTEFLEFQIDKFSFRVATERYYNAEGVWAKWEGAHVIIGMSDYLQQRSGDIAFIEIKAAGMEVRQGEEIALVETIKVNISLPSPVTGRVITVNPSMQTTPEIINQDPYGEGWLAIIEVLDMPIQMKQLMDAKAYFDKIKHEAENETRSA